MSSNPWELRPRLDVEEVASLYRRALEGGSAVETLVARRFELFASPMPCPVCACALSVYDAALDASHRIDESAPAGGYRCPTCETGLFRCETGRETDRLVWFWTVREPLDPSIVKRLRAETDLRMRGAEDLEDERGKILEALRDRHPCRTCGGNQQTDAGACVDCEGTGVEPAELAELLETGRIGG